MWAERLKLPKKGLQRALWGDYYFVPSPDGGPPKVKGHARAKDKKPVFVQLVIDQFYNIYKVSGRLLLELLVFRSRAKS